MSSCWLWGGGSWPRFIAAQIDAVVAAPAWVIAACRENGVAVDAVSIDETLAAATGDRRVVAFVAAAEDSSAAAQWRTLDASLFDALSGVAQRESVTLVVPWTEGTLLIDIARTKPKYWWRRWLGRRDAEAPAVGKALRSWRR